jgi:hypothetical protein
MSFTLMTVNGESPTGKGLPHISTFGTPFQFTTGLTTMAPTPCMQH